VCADAHGLSPFAGTGGGVYRRLHHFVAAHWSLFSGQGACHASVDSLRTGGNSAFRTRETGCHPLPRVVPGSNAPSAGGPRVLKTRLPANDSSRCRPSPGLHLSDSGTARSGDVGRHRIGGYSNSFWGRIVVEMARLRVGRGTANTGSVNRAR